MADEHCVLHSLTLPCPDCKALGIPDHKRERDRALAAGKVMKEGLVDFCSRLVKHAMETGDVEFARVVKEAYEATQAEISDKINAL